MRPIILSIRIPVGRPIPKPYDRQELKAAFALPLTLSEMRNTARDPFSADTTHPPLVARAQREEAAVSIDSSYQTPVPPVKANVLKG
jgi:hypothetical protein